MALPKTTHKSNFPSCKPTHTVCGLQRILLHPYSDIHWSWGVQDHKHRMATEFTQVLLWVHSKIPSWIPRRAISNPKHRQHGVWRKFQPTNLKLNFHDYSVVTLISKLAVCIHKCVKEFIAMHAVLNENIFYQVYCSANISFCTSMECFSTPCMQFKFCYVCPGFIFVHVQDICIDLPQ